MKKSQPSYVIPGYPSLSASDLVGQAAVEGQLVEYPKITRTSQDPPIQGQAIGNVSLMLFKEPRMLKTGKPVYGFFKLRGNWNDVPTAQNYAERIIREVDSKFEVLMAPVGAWMPITEEKGFCKEMFDVSDKSSEEVPILQDQAAKEKEKERQKKMREIRERERELKEGGDIYDDRTTLRYYSMRRVTELKLVEARQAKEKELCKINENILKVRKELKTLDSEYAEYTDQWIDCYNEERKKAGIPPFRPSADQFDEYENWEEE